MWGGWGGRSPHLRRLVPPAMPAAVSSVRGRSALGCTVVRVTVQAGTERRARTRKVETWYPRGKGGVCGHWDCVLAFVWPCSWIILSHVLELPQFQDLGFLLCLREGRVVLPEVERGNRRERNPLFGVFGGAIRTIWSIQTLGPFGRLGSFGAFLCCYGGGSPVFASQPRLFDCEVPEEEPGVRVQGLHVLL